MDDLQFNMSTQSFLWKGFCGVEEPFFIDRYLVYDKTFINISDTSTYAEKRFIPFHILTREHCLKDSFAKCRELSNHSRRNV